MAFPNWRERGHAYLYAPLERPDHTGQFLESVFTVNLQN